MRRGDKGNGLFSRGMGERFGFAELYRAHLERLDEDVQAETDFNEHEDGPVRIFSIDGSHTLETTLKDLKLDRTSF